MTIEQLWAPWRMEYVGSAGDASGCFLCGAVEDESHEYVVERTALTITMLNRFPYSTGHLLVAPRRHTPDIVAAAEDEAAGLMTGVRRAVRAVTAALHPDGFNVGLNHGTAAGASVDHLHLHVVPRWTGDTNFMPVLAEVKVLPDHLRNTAMAVRQAFEALRDSA